MYTMTELNTVPMTLEDVLLLDDEYLRSPEGQRLLYAATMLVRSSSVPAQRVRQAA